MRISGEKLRKFINIQHSTHKNDLFCSRKDKGEIHGHCDPKFETVADAFRLIIVSLFDCQKKLF